MDTTPLFSNIWWNSGELEFQKKWGTQIIDILFDSEINATESKCCWVPEVIFMLCQKWTTVIVFFFTPDAIADMIFIVITSGVWAEKMCM